MRSDTDSDPKKMKKAILKGNYNEISIKLKTMEESVETLLINAECSHGLGQYEEQFHYAERALDSDLEITMAQTFEAFYWMAWAQFRLGRHQEAFEIAQEGLQAISELKPEEQEYVKREHGRLKNVIASYYIESGNLDSGIQFLEEGYQLIKKTKDITLLATCYNNLGYAYQNRGDFTRAISDYNMGLSLLGENAYPSHQAMIFSNLGEAYRILGDYNLALQYHEQALHLREQLMNQYNHAIQLRYMGVLYFEIGDDNKAETYLKNSLNLWKGLNNDLWYSASLFDYCRVLLHKSVNIDVSLSKLYDLYRQTGNQIIFHRYQLIKAMELVNSPRMIQKAEAQRILRNLFERKKLEFEITYLSLAVYLKLLLEELKLSYHKDIVVEAIDIANHILKAVQHNNIFVKKVSIYLVLSRLHLFLGDINKAKAYFGQADLILMEYMADTLKVVDTEIKSEVSATIEREREKLELAEKFLLNRNFVSVHDTIREFGLNDFYLMA